MRRDFVPVYLITGFIESGKTTLGLTVLANDRFTNGGKVLILCCEEGETEWDEENLKKYRGVQVVLESADELEKLDEIDLPVPWGWAQVVTTADATTFDNYMTNMR